MLIPLYTGFPDGTVTLKALIDWYARLLAAKSVSVSIPPLPIVVGLAMLTTPAARDSG